MILTQSFAAGARSKRRYQEPSKTTGSWYFSYFGMAGPPGDAAQPKIGTLYPVAVHLEFDPQHNSDLHYHFADQFQVFLGGSGTLGKSALQPISVHYASAYSPYGPLRAGDEGLTYLTLRNSYDPGIHYVAEERAELKAANRQPRGKTVHVDPGCSTGATLIEPEADGLAAFLHDIAPGATLTGPAPSGGGGQYWIVLSGGGDVSGTTTAPKSCWFCSAGEPPATLTAGPHGAKLLLLQFPRMTEGPGVH